MSNDQSSGTGTAEEHGGKAQKASQEGACDHCGALVYGDSTLCSQCGHFPIKMHQCPRCKSIAAADAERCWKCGRVFEPDGDFL